MTEATRSKIDPDDFVKLVDEMRSFRGELDWFLTHKRSRDGMTDLFDMYAHLSPFIDAETEQDEELREKVAVALAIRDGGA